MPFATLDPTIRRLDLPTLGEAALIDTVGFITDLPTHLIDSFQATLEEAMQADLLVHVRDRSSPADLEQAEDVLRVLGRLEQETGLPLPPMIEAWNKADLLSPERAEALEIAALNQDGYPAVLLSAVTGRGMDDLLAAIERGLLMSAAEVRMVLKPEHGRARAWLHRNGEVLSEEIQDNGASLMTCPLEVRPAGAIPGRVPGDRNRGGGLTAYFSLLDRLPEAFLRIEVKLVEVLTALAGELFHRAKTAFELGIGLTQSHFGIDAEAAGQVCDNEEQIPDLILNCLSIA
jgi:hypothetical protein